MCGWRERERESLLINRHTCVRIWDNVWCLIILIHIYAHVQHVRTAQVQSKHCTTNKVVMMVVIRSPPHHYGKVGHRVKFLCHMQGFMRIKIMYASKQWLLSTPHSWPSYWLEYCLIEKQLWFTKIVISNFKIDYKRCKQTIFASLSDLHGSSQLSSILTLE